MLACSDPAGSLHVITPRRPGVEYYVEHCHGLSPPLITAPGNSTGSGTGSGISSGAGSCSSTTGSSSSKGGEMLVLTTGGSGDGELQLMCAAIGTSERCPFDLPFQLVLLVCCHSNF